LPAGFEGRRLLEPFAGGAALFFASPAPRAVLSDVNARLIDTYAAVRADVDSVVAHLAELAMRHDAASYYETRARFNAERFSCPAEAAAAFIYLNKTCFNGLYRVNRRGHFNVPMGRYTRPRILDVEGRDVHRGFLIFAVWP
jgi:DNA adenine methylase